MRYLRRVVGTTKRDRIRIERIRKEVKLKEALLGVIVERQLKCFGHVFHMTEEKRKVLTDHRNESIMKNEKRETKD